MSFFSFINHILSNPMLIVAFVLIIIVMAINGAMDAPNAIATCVTTRTLYIDHALIMSTVFNFLGVLLIAVAVRSKVALTIYNLVDFSNADFGKYALLAALFSIIIWGIITWTFNIPTSSSHALIASLIGSSIALNRGFSGINGSSFLKVIIGIVISVIVAFYMGKLIVTLIKLIFRNRDRRDSKRFFEVGNIASGALMSFAHGLQDGQKLIAILMLIVSFAGLSIEKSASIPVWMSVVCAISMGVGTFIGVKRVVKYIGMNVVNIETYEGFSADVASFITVIVSTAFGVPLSTTQTSTTSIMGVGAAKRRSNVNWSYAKYLSLNWFATFPFCGVIAFVLTKIFMLF